MSPHTPTDDFDDDSGPPRGAEAVKRLRSALQDAARLIADLETSLEVNEEMRGGDAGERIQMLEQQLDAAESDRDELACRLVEAEHQAGKLMNLYVATYQLHATLDPAEVQSSIAEIVVDLLGAERFALLLKNETGSGCEIALAKGADEDQDGLFSGQRYEGGDPMVDATLADGVLRIGPDEDSQVVATVPLRVEYLTVGALVILKLLDHRASDLSEDRDLLDLLAAHAASALFAARVYAATDRKLRTLQSLVELMRGG